MGEAQSALREFYGDDISSLQRLEQVIAFLETGITVRLVMSKGKKSALVPYVVSSRRRVSLGVKFFVRGIRARIRNNHLSLAEAIFEEATAVENGGSCYSYTIKADHMAQVSANLVAFQKRSRKRPY